MVDIKEAFLDRGFRAIKKSLSLLQEKGRVDQKEIESILTKIKGTLSVDEAAREADIVIEAAPENLELKTELFQKLDVLSPPHCILATNTSSLSITGIARATGRPEKVVGVHFASPVQVVRGVEIIKGVPHKNLWAKLGSGRLPRPWYSASLKVSAVLYP
jgi:3-hydroxybutyryl-CoA dehydrogenase